MYSLYCPIPAPSTLAFVHGRLCDGGLSGFLQNNNSLTTGLQDKRSIVSPGSDAKEICNFEPGYLTFLGIVMGK